MTKTLIRFLVLSALLLCGGAYALDVVSSVTPAATQDFSSGFTMFDRAVSLPNGKTITSVGFYSTAPRTLTVKIARENSSTNFDIVISEGFAHPGGGWSDHILATPYAVPASGTYRAGAFFAGVTDRNTNTARSYGSIGVDIAVSNGNTLTSDTGQVSIATRATAAVGVKWAPSARGTCVLLVVGQSNGGAWQGPGLYSVKSPRVQVMSIVDGLIAPAVEPLRGVDGLYSSYISMLADKMMDARMCSGVVIANVAVGGSTVASWAAGGANNSRIARAVTLLSQHGLAPSFTIINLGEQDAFLGTSRAAYLSSEQSLVSTIRAVVGNSPIFVARESKWTSGASTVADIQNAQADILSDANGVYAWGDMDALDDSYRRDGVHLATNGQSSYSDTTRAIAQNYQRHQ